MVLFYKNTAKSHHQFERSKTVAYKRNGFSNGRQISTVEDPSAGKFETKKNFRSYSVHEKEINADFNDDLQAAIVCILTVQTYSQKLSSVRLHHRTGRGTNINAGLEHVIRIE